MPARGGRGSCRCRSGRRRCSWTGMRTWREVTTLEGRRGVAALGHRPRTQRHQRLIGVGDEEEDAEKGKGLERGVGA
jgi:hypothetical protein